MPATVTALVSGGSRGIGAATVRRLASAGARVIVAARNLVRAAGVVESIRESGGDAQALPLDVTEPASVAELARRAGAIDWLVNNAGVADTAPLLPRPGTSNDELYQRLLEVNLHGARRLIEAFGPGMIERGRGSIVNVASSASLQGYAYAAGYCAAKHALLGYTRAAALELERKGVRVHAVCPHYVDTDLTAESVRRIVSKTGRSTEEAREFLAAQNPGGRLIEPQEVAEAVLTLLQSERSGLLAELDGRGPALLRPWEPQVAR